jgi:hypothetical protein
MREHIRVPPSKKLRNLHKALSEMSECMNHAQWFYSYEGFVVSCTLGPSIKDEITRLAQQVDCVVNDYLVSARRKTEDPQTTFFVHLYHLYTIISGKTSITDTGPAARFIRECAALVDPTIIVPKRLRDLIVKAITRKRAEIEKDLRDYDLQKSV